MIPIHQLREEKEEIIKRLKIRGFDGSELATGILKIDQERRKTQKELDDNQAKNKKLAGEINQLFKAGKQDEAKKKREESSRLKHTNKDLGERLRALENQLQEQMINLPNIPHPSIPKGSTGEDNQLIRKYGKLPQLNEKAFSHWELAENFALINFDAGNLLTGKGFPVYEGQGARLQRAMINFFLDQAVKAGYREFQPPLLVNEDTGFGTGQLPDKEGQMYHLEKENYYLIPTAEVPLTNLYRSTVLEETGLPIKLTAYTPCFRREAGSWGKDVRGLNRLHQFDKVEIVQIQKPENSYDTLENMVKFVEGLLKKLELSYRLVKLCGGDLGFAAAFTYDLEVYSGGQKKWLEVSSISNFECFQANRLNLRYRDKSNKKHYVHTLNGSALAFPRLLAALLENNQAEDHIRIPGALVPYTGFDKITIPPG